tara:strand:- start:5508 stop:6686 length:1179 start_codon:yes stop_codon:yes gene_type:complete
MNSVDENDITISEDVAAIDKFEDMGLSENILKGLYSFGFETPSMIQQRAIAPIISGRDIIAQSQSGTGKTATFLIGILQNIDTSKKKLQSIILAPTRELAKQISSVAEKISKYMDVNIKTVIGGTKRSKYSYDYADVNHIIIGTPGRISDSLTRGTIDVSDLKIMVLDEADEMLSHGFRDQLITILKYIPTNAQIGLFSATIPPEMMKITRKFMQKPLKILVKKNDVTLDGIKQYYVAIENEQEKFECICALYSTINITQSIIYANYKKTVEWLAKNMQEKDFPVDYICGGMTSEERADIMTKFRSGDIRVLISTDLLSRGIDVQQISLVVNYDIPFEKETYIHRIGRSGRYGRKGVAINLVNQKDFQRFKTIQDTYETTIDELPEDIANLI